MSDKTTVQDPRVLMPRETRNKIKALSAQLGLPTMTEFFNRVSNLPLATLKKLIGDNKME